MTVKTVVCIVVYWVVSGVLLLLPEIFGDKGGKLTWKDWVPTFVLAPLIFPFFVAMWKHGEASFGAGPKDKTAKKEEKK